MNTQANFPSGNPLDASGNLTPHWRLFFMALFSRTGSESGNDTSAMQKAIADLQTETSAGEPSPDLSKIYALIDAAEAVAAQAMAAAVRAPDERGESGDASATGDLLNRIRELEQRIDGASGASTFATQDFDAQLGAGVSIPTDTAHLTNGAGFVTTEAGRLLAIRSLSNGTYTPTAGANTVLVRMQGPGGAGGGTAATGAGQSAAAGGGGAGAYVEALFAASALNGLTVSLGTAGAGVSAAAGGAGTAATFGSAISAPGGTGGNAGSALSAPGFTAGSGTTAAATVTGGTTLLSIPGIGGNAGLVFAAGSLSESGPGGNSPIGAGGQPRLGTGANVGAGFGFGGGGANAQASQAAQTGASGGNGWCEVWEFS
ncbi:hypothetical protein [Burkholderia sp. HI2500]|uniref:hypothetical protein n=1 Tax=Burkholderia sp. HI2500 TaxID=2015358 RepID=UPI00117E60EA|nr:hypothetical protein [Burkholderia sp. HI2500]